MSVRQVLVFLALVLLAAAIPVVIIAVTSQGCAC